MTKIAESGSISQKVWIPDPDPYPYQNVMDPQLMVQHGVDRPKNRPRLFF
jgi:hypothetical protein